jgi:hypothetical protein
MLADSGVHIAFCSNKIRIQHTIEPLRKRPARTSSASMWRSTPTTSRTTCRKSWPR